MRVKFSNAVLVVFKITDITVQVGSVRPPGDWRWGESCQTTTINHQPLSILICETALSGHCVVFKTSSLTSRCSATFCPSTVWQSPTLRHDSICDLPVVDFSSYCGTVWPTGLPCCRSVGLEPSPEAASTRMSLGKALFCGNLTFAETASNVCRSQHTEASSPLADVLCKSTFYLLSHWVSWLVQLLSWS